MEIKLKTKKLAIDAVQPNPWNPNRQSDRAYEAEKESIQAFGFLDPITVRQLPEGGYQIVDGEHRWKAMKELGASEISANVVELTDDQAKKLTIILNETRGQADRVDLAKLLAELQPVLGDDLITGLPYSGDELDELLKLADVNWDDFSDKEKGERKESDADGDVEAFGVKMSQEAYAVLEDAYNLVAQEHTLPKDKAFAWGSVLFVLASEYTGRSGPKAGED